MTKKELYRLKKKGKNPEDERRQTSPGQTTSNNREERYTWKEKEAMEAQQEEMNSVAELFAWENRVFKKNEDF